MSKVLLSAILIPLFVMMAKAQSSRQGFDTIQFNNQLEFTSYLVEYEFYNQAAIRKFSQQEDVSSIEWFSYHENNSWYTVGGNVTGDKFKIMHHVIFDSLNLISDFTGTSDISKLNAAGFALSAANIEFQIIRDTCSIYFSTFVIKNPDHTISVWYLPALQPSGQAIYGCEWEYIFDNSGKNLLRRNSFINKMTGVWIGQPRELWLNYRNTDNPTIGSIFFTLSFCDYFTRTRIDTRISTSTISKDATGIYSWKHKMK